MQNPISIFISLAVILVLNAPALAENIQWPVSNGTPEVVSIVVGGIGCEPRTSPPVSLALSLAPHSNGMLVIPVTCSSFKVENITIGSSSGKQVTLDTSHDSHGKHGGILIGCKTVTVASHTFHITSLCK